MVRKASRQGLRDCKKRKAVFGDDSDWLLLFYVLVTGKEWAIFIVDVIRKLLPLICTDDTDRKAKPTTEARRHGENPGEG